MAESEGQEFKWDSLDRCQRNLRLGIGGEKNWTKGKSEMEDIATVLRLKILFISQLFTKEVAVYKRELEKILTTFFPRVL